MPVVSADSLQLAHVEMPDANSIPASPSFELWRTTGESLVFSPNTSESGELGGSGRTRKPANVTGMSISGDINFELSKFTALEQAIEGVMAEDWGECPLTGAPGGAIDSDARVTVGKDERFFLIEKRFPNPDYQEGAVPTVAVASSPGPTPTITFTGVAAVGSGAVTMEFRVDGGEEQVTEVQIMPSDDADAVAAKAVTAINMLDGITATDGGGGVVNLATAGTNLTVTARAGNDQYFFQRYIGSSYSVLNLTASPNNPVTGSVSIVGGSPKLDKLPLDGASYASAGSSAVFTAPEVMELSVGSVLGIGTHCWTNLSIVLDSQNRGVACIGHQGDKEVVLGTLAASLTGDVYFSDDAVLAALLANESVGDGAVVFANADDEMYRFDFPDLKPISGTLSAGGTGQDLTMPLGFEPTPRIVCDDGMGVTWDAGVVISRDLNVAPTWPSPITASASSVVGDSSTITIGGGPADKAYTLTITYQVDLSGTDEFYVVSVSQGDTIADVLTTLQGQVTGDLVTANPTATTVDIGLGTATSMEVCTVTVVPA